jgi:hypothetical protein
MGRRKANAEPEEPEQDYMDGTEPPERLGADAPEDEVIRAQQEVLDSGNVLVVLGKFDAVCGVNKERLLAKFAMTNRPDFISMLAVMQNNYVGFMEPVRGGKGRPPLNLHGEITRFTAVHGSHPCVTVWIDFEKNESNIMALMQIDSANPKTVIMYATQSEIPEITGDSIE